MAGVPYDLPMLRVRDEGPVSLPPRGPRNTGPVWATPLAQDRRNQAGEAGPAPEPAMAEANYLRLMHVLARTLWRTGHAVPALEALTRLLPTPEPDGKPDDG